VLTFYYQTATPGNVVNVFMAILIGSISLAQLAPEMQAINYACRAAAMLYKTIDRIPDIDSSNSGGLKPKKVEGHITFENVKFNYPSRPNEAVVKDLSISFPAGKTAALVGASGSGKSTVVALVERFYDPLGGVVRLDGINIKELNIKWLRSQIGLVSQEPVLFATTIKESVAHGLIGTEYEHASEEKKFALIKGACSVANADGFINNMPMGYDTMVGERGFLLSGGQKQRIAIARAIVSDPKILMLDEATSALDPQSEGIVQDALDKAAAGRHMSTFPTIICLSPYFYSGRTTIAIAHRLSTVKDANRIFVMGDGLVLEEGTHSELLRNNSGPYARFVAAQKLDEKCKVELGDSDSDTGSGKGADMAKKAQGEVSLLRRNSSHSHPDEIVGQKKTSKMGQDGDHSLLYVFMRIVKLNRDAWKRYGIGAVAAWCTYLFVYLLHQNL
jgi:ATP-binding cassette subfamily B (MDR/TAP) protein 1